ncbi:MAG: nucleoside-diphosphate kinase [Candidatus Tectomicrobia bacterium]|uniref:Nucleoside diphosphate kinase n=1 Tax=Tectimicrobiota bacterium TaxID=2528274 RepID=A0A933LQS1_UNCTE|nr:nucleoside-diphosphate kinase [Candidatus Tectomicrobia bacterium]
MERTLAIIKPDATKRGLAGKIMAKIEEAGFKIVALRMLRMTKEEAQGFYKVHEGRSFFDSLTTFMSSGEVIVMVLEKAGAVENLRKLMGATNPAQAESGTIRKEFALDIEKNSIHGSDAPESAAAEIPFFFPEIELLRKD